MPPPAVQGCMEGTKIDEQVTELRAALKASEGSSNCVWVFGWKGIQGPRLSTRDLMTARQISPGALDAMVEAGAVIMNHCGW